MLGSKVEHKQWQRYDQGAMSITKSATGAGHLATEVRSYYRGQYGRVSTEVMDRSGLWTGARLFWSSSPGRNSSWEENGK